MSIPLIESLTVKIPIKLITIHEKWLIINVNKYKIFHYFVRLASSPPTTMAPPLTTTPERPFFDIQTKNNIFETPIFRQRDNKTNQFTDKGKIKFEIHIIYNCS